MSVFLNKIHFSEIPMSEKKHFVSLPLFFIYLVNAVALTGATPLAQKKEITRQLMTLAERRPLQPGEEEIKLCYITVSLNPPFPPDDGGLKSIDAYIYTA